MEVLTIAIACHEGHSPADDIFVLMAVCSQHLLEFLTRSGLAEEAQSPGSLAGLLAVGIAAAIAGSRSSRDRAVSCRRVPEMLGVLGRPRRGG